MVDLPEYEKGLLEIENDIDALQDWKNQDFHYSHFSLSRFQTAKMWKFYIASLNICFFYCLMSQMKFASGADFFESLLVRLRCYGDARPEGCETDLIDVYENVSLSIINTTKARTDMYLFTKNNKDIPENLSKCGGNLPPNTNFQCGCPVIIYLPGFVSGICNFAIYREIKDQYLKRKECYNMIMVDWMWGNSLDLITAVDNMMIVASQVVIVIRKLKERCNLSSDHFKLVGHSLGAHVAAFIGQKERVSVIVGLDPAGVVFTEKTPLDQRLDPSDADTVIVAHCNGGQCLPNYFGVNFTCGHVDFWINGGLHQPSCVKSRTDSFLKGDYIFGTLSLIPAACSHFQCLQYYKAAIAPDGCQFIGVECNNREDFDNGKCTSCGENGEKCLVFGPDTSSCLTEEQRSRHRNYYFKTKLECPYCDNNDLEEQYSCNIPPPQSSSCTCKSYS